MRGVWVSVWLSAAASLLVGVESQGWEERRASAETAGSFDLAQMQEDGAILPGMDNHLGCCVWLLEAAEPDDQCDVNPFFMKTICQRTCGVLDCPYGSDVDFDLKCASDEGAKANAIADCRSIQAGQEANPSHAATVSDASQDAAPPPPIPEQVDDPIPTTAAPPPPPEPEEIIPPEPTTEAPLPPPMPSADTTAAPPPPPPPPSPPQEPEPSADEPIPAAAASNYGAVATPKPPPTSPPAESAVSAHQTAEGDIEQPHRRVIRLRRVRTGIRSHTRKSSPAKPRNRIVLGRCVAPQTEHANCVYMAHQFQSAGAGFVDSVGRKWSFPNGICLSRQFLRVCPCACARQLRRRIRARASFRRSN